METTALEKRTCAACGAPAQWHPARQALICPFCGTVAPVEENPETGAVEEIDLVQTLRNLPEERRGWDHETRSVRCQSCHAISVFGADKVGRNCDFCGSPQIVDYEEIKPPIRPNGVIPFSKSATYVRDAVRRWFGGKWLTPNLFKKRASIDTIHGVYIPYWTFDAQVDCPWQADSGTYYYTTESYRDSQGRRQTRQKRQVRWQPTAGRLQHFFDDEPVSGTHGLKRDLLRQIEPFPTGESSPYSPSFLAGFTVEHYQVVLVDATRQSRESMQNQLMQLCAGEVPGDTHRNLRIQPEYDQATFKHVLVPVWLLAYDYHGKAFQVLINGATGAIAGSYPRSFWKMLGLGLAGLFLVILALLFSKFL